MGGCTLRTGGLGRGTSWRPKNGQRNSAPKADHLILGLGGSGVPVGGRGVEAGSGPGAEMGGVGPHLQKLLVTPVGEQGAEPDAVPLQLQEPVVALLDGAAQLPQSRCLLFLHKIQDLHLQLFDLLDDL